MFLLIVGVEFGKSVYLISISKLFSYKYLNRPKVFEKFDLVCQCKKTLQARNKQINLTVNGGSKTKTKYAWGFRTKNGLKMSGKRGWLHCCQRILTIHILFKYLCLNQNSEKCGNLSAQKKEAESGGQPWQGGQSGVFFIDMSDKCVLLKTPCLYLSANALIHLRSCFSFKLDYSVGKLLLLKMLIFFCAHVY